MTTLDLHAELKKNPAVRNLAMAEMARQSFKHYVKYVHDNDLPRHCDVMVQALTTTDPDKKSTAVSAPPEFWKSRLLRMYIEWSIGINPDYSRILVMNTSTQAQLQIMAVQDTLLNNMRYQQVFPHVKPDSDRAWNRDRFFIKRDKSSRPDPTLVGCGMLGPVQGLHVEEIYCDDVTDPQDPRSETTMLTQREWIRGLLSDRLIRDSHARPIGCFYAVLTRWGEGDLWPMFTSTNPNEGMGFEAIELPAVRPNNPYPWGELLWPEVFPMSRLNGVMRQKGSALYTMTYLCDPTALGGIIFDRSKWNRFDLNEPPDFTMKIHSWDTAMGLSAEAAYSVMQEWSVGPQGFYLTHIWRERVIFSKLLDMVYQFYDERQPNIVLIEDKSTGTSLIQEIGVTGRIPGLRGIRPELKSLAGSGAKEARAHRASAKLEQGMLFIPNDALWLNEFLREVTGFPKTRFSDQVDALAQATEYLGKRSRVSKPVGSWMVPAPPIPLPTLDDQEEIRERLRTMT